MSCDASVVTGTPFDPPTDHGSAPGFFAQSGTNYAAQCEPKLAGKLEALAQAKRLHLVGVLGYATASASSSASPGASTRQPSEVRDTETASHASGVRWKRNS